VGIGRGSRVQIKVILVEDRRPQQEGNAAEIVKVRKISKSSFLRRRTSKLNAVAPTAA
jgi:hypothetical protein